MRAQENSLIESAILGDTEALNTLLGHIRPTVLRQCYRMLPHPEDAEEACQDALLAVSKNIVKFEKRSRFSTWVHRITSNAALQTYRKLKKRAVEQPTDTFPVVVEPRTTSVIAGTTIDLIEALGKLKEDRPELAEPLMLRQFAKLKYDEIAEWLDVPINTVKTRLRSARQQLADMMAERIG